MPLTTFEVKKPSSSNYSLRIHSPAITMVDKMKVYVHGSCRNVDGQYPVAVSTAVFTHESGTHKAWTRIVPAHPTPTRQRADLMAIVLALEKAMVDDGRLYTKRAVDLNIYSGSLYAVKSLTDWADRWIYNGWIGTDGREVDNKDLIKRALQVEGMLMDGGSVRYTCLPKEEKTEANTYCEHALNLWMGGFPVGWEWEWPRNGRQM